MSRPLSTDERFGRLFPLIEEYERRQSQLRMDEDYVRQPQSRGPLVSIERAHEIRQFNIAMAELQHAFGLRLQCFEDGEPLAIVDARNELPEGYLWSALIRADGSLEIADFVADEF